MKDIFKFFQKLMEMNKNPVISDDEKTISTKPNRYCKTLYFFNEKGGFVGADTVIRERLLDKMQRMNSYD